VCLIFQLDSPFAASDWRGNKAVIEVVFPVGGTVNRRLENYRLPSSKEGAFHVYQPEPYPLVSRVPRHSDSGHAAFIKQHRRQLFNPHGLPGLFGHGKLYR
jgi:hypothetical protein